MWGSVCSAILGSLFFQLLSRVGRCRIGTVAEPRFAVMEISKESPLLTASQEHISASETSRLVDVSMPKKTPAKRKAQKKTSPTKPLQPEIVEMKPLKMAVIVTKGDPNKVAANAMPALFGSVYKLRFELKKKGVEFKVGGLRARWPDAHLIPKDQWTGIWGLPVPDDVNEISQKMPEIEVKLETWQYGTVAQILHLGPYSTEGSTVERLHQFIKENGFEIAGVHEEEYLTGPRAKTQKTIIRYPVKRTEAKA